MANFNRAGIGGFPVGDARQDQRKPKFDHASSEYTNILNHGKVLNHSIGLNTDTHLNLERALNEYKPISFKSSDDILEILQSHPEIQRLPKPQLHGILAAVISALGAGVGFALTIHLGGVGGLAGANLTVTAVLKFAGATALTSGGAAGNIFINFRYSYS